MVAMLIGVAIQLLDSEYQALNRDHPIYLIVAIGGRNN